MSATQTRPACSQLRSILYVEDDVLLRDMARLVLEVLGKFSVRECSSGYAALLAVVDFHPDLILLGEPTSRSVHLDTLAMLRRLPRLAATPAVFLTGLPSESDIARYRLAGALGVIPKPLVPMRLTAQVRSLWEQCRPMAL